MESLTMFKIGQFIVFLTFTFFISDIRRKEGMSPLISDRFIITMELCYLILLCNYGYMLITLDLLLPSDFGALAMTSLGTFIVMKAKTDLRRHHTWAGYHFKTTKLMTKGIYAFIRHPIYTGIYIFTLGGFLIGTARLGGFPTGILRDPWALTTIGSTLVYVMTLLHWRECPAACCGDESQGGVASSVLLGAAKRIRATKVRKFAPQIPHSLLWGGSL